MLIDVHTRIYGIIGHPLSHSLSPVMHNRAFQEIDFNGVYLAFPFADCGEALQTLEKINVQGLSVTIPHKKSVLQYAIKVDPVAQTIGAANTLIWEDKGEERGWHAFNSDAWGAYEAIVRYQKSLNEPINLRKKNDALLSTGNRLSYKNILIMGNGGAARAISFILGAKMDKARLSIAVRSLEKGGGLFQDLQSHYPDRISLTALQELDGENSKDYDLIINATPLGMFPQTDSSPLPANCLHAHQTVFDTVYNPHNTKLLQDAYKRGAQIIHGLDMLLFQGVFQFEKFTGQKAPIEVMEKSLQRALAIK